VIVLEALPVILIALAITLIPLAGDRPGG
jgi:hypothetical protein